jgi:hypothetical protein
MKMYEEFSQLDFGYNYNDQDPLFGGSTQTSIKDAQQTI